MHLNFGFDGVELLAEFLLRLAELSFVLGQAGNQNLQV